VNRDYFDVKQDIQIINAGGFICQACLVGKPAAEQSPDSRYCQGCYEFLLGEAKMLTDRHHHDWIPMIPEKAPEANKIAKQSVVVVGEGSQIMSTLNDKKSEVDIIQPSVAKVTRGKRGPKQQALPQELITQWASEGMGSKAIATKLRKKQDITVSYKTIQRVLSGERAC